MLVAYMFTLQSFHGNLAYGLFLLCLNTYTFYFSNFSSPRQHIYHFIQKYNPVFRAVGSFLAIIYVSKYTGYISHLSNVNIAWEDIIY